MLYRLLRYPALSSALLASTMLHAQAGSVDPTFNPGDHGYYGYGAISTIRACLPLPDGRYLIGGWMTTYNNSEQRGLVVLHADGTLDTSATFPFNGFIEHIVPDKVGRFLVCGFWFYGGQPSPISLSRLNSDLTVDSVFQSNFSFSASTYSVAVQSDEKILVGGAFTTAGGAPSNSLLRLNDDGTIDTTFHVDVGITGPLWGGVLLEGVYSILPLSDGRILAGGSFDGFGGLQQSGIVCLDSTGDVDTTFMAGAGFTGVFGQQLSRVEVMRELPDSTILVGGSFTTYNTVAVPCLARLRHSGLLDTTYHALNPPRPVRAILTLPGGKHLVGGECPESSGYTKSIKRHLANGNPDTTFAMNHRFGLRGVDQLSVDLNGMILTCGGFESSNDRYQKGVTRLDADGVQDTTFNVGWGAHRDVRDIQLLPDGRSLVTGQLRAYNNHWSPGALILHSNGTVDTTFNIEAGFNYHVLCAAVQPDGDMLLAGNYIEFRGDPLNRIIRLNPDGSRDWSFNAPANDDVFDIRSLANNKTLVAGEFTSVSGGTASRIARLTPTGTLDPTFSAAPISTGAIECVAVQPNGKYLAGGYGTLAAHSLRRLNDDGSLDPTLTFETIPGPLGAVNALALQPDGKVLVGGRFTTCNGQVADRLVRVLPDGTIDPTFSIGTGFNDDVSALLLQPDGKVLVGGFFTECNGVQCNHFVRLHTDGSIDPTLDTGTGFASVDTNMAYLTSVHAIALQTDQRILVGGEFNTYNGQPREFILRLENDFTTNATVLASGATFSVFPSPTDGPFTIHLSPFDSGTLQVIDATGRTVLRAAFVCTPASTASFDISSATPGLYTLQVSSEAGMFTRKLMKQ